MCSVTYDGNWKDEALNKNIRKYFKTVQHWLTKHLVHI